MKSCTTLSAIGARSKTEYDGQQSNLSALFSFSAEQAKYYSIYCIYCDCDVTVHCLIFNCSLIYEFGSIPALSKETVTFFVKSENAGGFINDFFLLKSIIECHY